MSATTTEIKPIPFFKALADPIRLRIVHLLTLRPELCVCHLTEILTLPQSSISRHLATLRNSGIVLTRKDGLWVHYRLAIGEGSPYIGIIREVTKLAEIEPQLAEDAARLPESTC
ncbi:MAG: metalloregulator ArsR/SmtB family transcription factor [Mariprofundales bacterium]|nr:metalloregulator ArsR/SmtB family transcription factor [Mariprofundales bacterium]